MASRGLSQLEISVAYHRVFHDTIPYDKIMLSSKLGVGGLPYTVPDVTSIGRYIISIGTDKYWKARKPEQYWATLIHELTHVWQGYNSFFAWNYTFNSLWWQAHKGQGAYRYSKAQWFDWDDYNVEQQAQIVEDWFAAGYKTSDPRWRYIRDNIRNP